MDKIISRTISEIDKVKNENLELNDKLNRARAENEQLKADIQSRTMCITCERELQNCNLQAENERLKEELENLDRLQKLDHSYVIRYRNLLSKYVDKYKQTLQEIREIAREWLYNDWSCFHCRSNMDDKLQDILTKINEVIGAE